MYPLGIKYHIQNMSNYPDRYTTLSDFVDQVTTTEADDIYHRYSNQRGGQPHSPPTELDVNKPTIILYWGDWCGPSLDFKPYWDQFKLETGPKMFPGLQITDLNCRRADLEAGKLAKEVGVITFPTMVLFIDGQTYIMTAGGKDVSHIVNFVKKYMW
jgi:thiol-disulfide isomerase/thioredoxin